MEVGLEQGVPGAHNFNRSLLSSHSFVMKLLRRNLNSRLIRTTLCTACAFTLVLLYKCHFYVATEEQDATDKLGLDAGNIPIPGQDQAIKNVNLYDLYWKLKNEVEKDDSRLIGPNVRIQRESLLRPSGYSSNEDFDDRVVAQLVWSHGLMNGEFKSGTKNVKKILLIDKFSWWNYNGTQVSESCRGIEQKCEFVEPSRGIAHGAEIGDMDAVVAVRDFAHFQEISVAENVTRIYFTMESPVYSMVLLTRDNDLLASFWRGSDIVNPYGKWVYYDQSIRQQYQGRNYATGKSKLAAIFISHCITTNNRLDYVVQLKQFIPVDIYGSCGEHHCPRSDKSGCFAKLKLLYKFYLAFENANCRDYITEKVYENAYENDVVPIVMGAHPDDYRAVLPFHSYIHVEDFENPEALANYLQYLDTHDEEYNKYFEWKGTGDFIQSEVFCRFCAMLHSEDHTVKYPKRTEPFSWDESNMNLCLPHNRTNWK